MGPSARRDVRAVGLSPGTPNRASQMNRPPPRPARHRKAGYRIFGGPTWFAVVAVLVAALSSCSGQAPTLFPPTLERVGLIVTAEAHSGFVRFTLSDGGTWEARTGAYRAIGHDGGGGLLVAGRDQHGRFLAIFPTQDGLPSDCYVENATGVERDAYIELRGVLWDKAPDFTSAVPIPSVGGEYASGTRFCLNEFGRVAATVAPNRAVTPSADLIATTAPSP